MQESEQVVSNVFLAGFHSKETECTARLWPTKQAVAGKRTTELSKVLWKRSHDHEIIRCSALLLLLTSHPIPCSYLTSLSISRLLPASGMIRTEQKRTRLGRPRESEILGLKVT